jgi:hypothetical protein
MAKKRKSGSSGDPGGVTIAWDKKGKKYKVTGKRREEADAKSQKILDARDANLRHDQESILQQHGAASQGEDPGGDDHFSFNGTLRL